MNNKLIEENLEYVRRMAFKSMKYVPDEKKGMVSSDDLFSAGCVGLIEAAKRYKTGWAAKFTTYAYNWIKGKMIKELIFYIGKDALLINDEELERYASKGFGEANEVLSYPEISSIPEEEQVKIIRRKLKVFGLTDDEMRVFLAINGIGCDKVTNLTALAREIKKREFEIRRIKQRAEEKVKKATS